MVNPSFLLMLILFGVCACELVVNSPSEYAKTYVGPSARLNDVSWTNVTAQLILVDSDACETLQVNATGKIVMYKQVTSELFFVFLTYEHCRRNKSMSLQSEAPKPAKCLCCRSSYDGRWKRELGVRNAVRMN